MICLESGDYVGGLPIVSDFGRVISGNRYEHETSAAGCSMKATGVIIEAGSGSRVSKLTKKGTGTVKVTIRAPFSGQFTVFTYAQTSSSCLGFGKRTLLGS